MYRTFKIMVAVLALSLWASAQEFVSLSAGGLYRGADPRTLEWKGPRGAASPICLELRGRFCAHGCRRGTLTPCWSACDGRSGDSREGPVRGGRPHDPGERAAGRCLARSLRTTNSQLLVSAYSEKQYHVNDGVIHPAILNSWELQLSGRR